MFGEIKSLDIKTCPVCNGQMAIGQGGCYRHIKPTRCGYYEKVTDAILTKTPQAESKSQEQ